MSIVDDAIARLRRPEYTGENRCLPCTAVNLVIAAGLAVAVAALLPSRAAPAVGAAVLGLSLVGIALRGYLVPGTPWLTRTYFPDWLLARFDKPPASTPPATAADELDVEATLRRWGALEACADVDDLCLTPAFEDAWRERIAALRTADVSRADLAAIVGTDPEGLDFEEYGGAFVANEGTRRIGQWESRAAFLADVAAGTVLADRADGWADLRVHERGALMTGLRLFVEECPTCGGPVTLDEAVKQSCCRSFDVAAATCGDCGARLFEAELPEAA